jgi:peptide-methionine (S)-S-oxide reductase
LVVVHRLLDVFFDKVDPTTLNRQGNDRGTQYRSGIYYHDEEQKQVAAKKIQEVNDKLARGEKVGA